MDNEKIHGIGIFDDMIDEAGNHRYGYQYLEDAFQTGSFKRGTPEHQRFLALMEQINEKGEFLQGA